MKRSKCSLTLLCISGSLLALSLGCGSGGSGGGLEGNLQTTLFEILSGETRTVTGDLTINASTGITIAGTLRIPPGVNVNLVTPGTVHVTGTIGVAPGRVASRNGEPQKKILIYAGNGATFENDVEVASDFLIAVGPGIDLSYGGRIEGRDGDDGTSTTDHGEDGANIEIGSPDAVSAAKVFFPVATAPDTLTLNNNASLIGGDGGDGFTDANGKLNGKNLTVRGSNGGHGGDVKVGAGTEVIIQGTIRAGNGGKGGDAGVAGVPPAALDGTQPGEAGGNVSCGAGDGGNKGLAYRFINGNDRSNATSELDGDNGKGGNSFVKAGNGGPQGNGGNITCALSTDGTNTRILSTPGHETGTFSGGNGGASESPNSTGGNGGSLSISTSDSQPARQKITVVNFGSGGGGFDGCSVLPNVSGTAGGNGGTVTGSNTLLVDFTNSGIGGKGGNGTPNQGAGGEKGHFDTIRFGEVGAAGSPCAYAPDTVVGVGFIAVVLDTTIVPGILQAGDTVPLIRIDGGRPAAKHTPVNEDHGCINDHLHDLSGGIRIRHRLNGQSATTPLAPDPAPSHCGYGKLVIVNSPEIRAANPAVK